MWCLNPPSPTNQLFPSGAVITWLRQAAGTQTAWPGTVVLAEASTPRASLIQYLCTPDRPARHRYIHAVGMGCREMPGNTLEVEPEYARNEEPPALRMSP